MTMKKVLSRTLLLIAAAVLCISAVILTVSCSGSAGLSVSGLGVIHEPEFGGIYIRMTIDEFNAKGFEYGDSVRIAFSNGYVLEDLPYYNGYYTVTGNPLLIAYPGYDYIKAAINNGADLWDVAGLTETDTAEITLSARGKYAGIQSARNIHYKDDRSLFPSDEVFANFRSIEAGKLKKDLVYRSASPCDNQHNRATYTDALMAEAGVRYIIDLADSDTKIRGYISAEGFSCMNFLALYEAGKVDPVAMNMNYGSDEFRSKVAAAVGRMTENEGPYLIHCTEGKDRTGFVCMLIEAFAGASYDEIVRDYMITYDNYYEISEQKDKKRYDVIIENVLDPMIGSMVGDSSVDIKTADLSVCAEKFLLSAGLSEETIEALRTILIG